MLTLLTLLANTEPALMGSLEKFVWADYRVAVVFLVFLPLILLIWAFIQKNGKTMESINTHLNFELFINGVLLFINLLF